MRHIDQTKLVGYLCIAVAVLWFAVALFGSRGAMIAVGIVFACIGAGCLHRARLHQRDRG